jgi:Ca-activated chloride channel homolog
VDELFLWPLLLLATVVLPLAVWRYRASQRRSAKAVLLHTDLPNLRVAAAHGRRWARHLPAVLYAMALGVGLLALARPTAAVLEAHPHAGIMLALDVSLSMTATDVSPSRIRAAEEALVGFVRGLPAGIRVGLVTFAGYATTVVPLTDDHERVIGGVGALSLGRGTVIGDALLEALRSFPDLEERQALGGDPASYAVIVLLSDGANRGGTSPALAVRELEAAQVRVHTIGVGSAAVAAQQPFGSAMRFDESTLRMVADSTGGRYAFVDSSEALHDVYRELGRSLAWRVRRDEATGYASLLAGVMLAASLGMAWFRRGP